MRQSPPSAGIVWSTFLGALAAGSVVIVAPVAHFWATGPALMALGVVLILAWTSAKVEATKNAQHDRDIAESQRQIDGIDAELAERASQRAAEAHRAAERPGLLRERYGEEMAQRLLDGEIWQGQTEEQLRESLGPPVATEEKVLKTKTVRIFKYSEAGENRYRLKVKVENGVIVGWEDSR